MNRETLSELERLVAAKQPAALVTILDDPAFAQGLVTARGLVAGALPSGAPSEVLVARAQACLAELASRREEIRIDDRSFDVFFDVHPPPPQLIVIGAVHVAIHLVGLAKRLGYSTVVIDPRSAFATEERFDEADRLIDAWPAEALATLDVTANTYFALLSHNLEIDLPALEVALRSGARYVGALGSRKTHAKRVAALRERGFGDQEIDRIHNPIGLDLGGRSAEEIALAIMAEVVAARHGRA